MLFHNIIKGCNVVLKCGCDTHVNIVFYPHDSSLNNVLFVLHFFLCFYTLPKKTEELANLNYYYIPLLVL